MFVKVKVAELVGEMEVDVNYDWREEYAPYLFNQDEKSKKDVARFLQARMREAEHYYRVAHPGERGRKVVEQVLVQDPKLLEEVKLLREEVAAMRNAGMSAKAIEAAVDVEIKDAKLNEEQKEIVAEQVADMMRPGDAGDIVEETPTEKEKTAKKTPPKGHK